MYPEINDRGLLHMMRITMVCFACIVMSFALTSEPSIFKIVESAYKITLAGAFVPLFFGAYWSRATTQGALAAVIGGGGNPPRGRSPAPPLTYNLAMESRGPVLLARYLALVWYGLVIYGSLHPFSGWRDSGISPLAFLDGGWPRYWTAFDLAANVAVYLPLGFFLTLAMYGLPGRFTAAVVAALLAAGLSFSLETAQTWLPSRVPSNVDLACNSIGGILGALWAQAVGPRIFTRIGVWQQRLVAPVAHAELGLTLLGLWLLVPLSPETLLFGAGDLRQLLGLSGAVPFAAESFVLIDASVTALNALAVGLIVRMLCARLLVAYMIVPLFLVLGLAIRTLAAAILIDPGEALAWLTPGAQTGLLLAGLALAMTLPLPATARVMLAALALMAGTVLVNLAPPNPYSAAALATWRQGHFLNFNGLTRLVSTIWPFLTLPFLLLTTRRL